MAKKMKAEFEKGWRVLVHLPTRAGVQQGIVGDTGKRKADGYRGAWVWVTVEGTSFLVPEKDIEHKTDEPYCLEFAAELQRATLVIKSGRERIVTPKTEKWYLKSMKGSGWWYDGTPVSRMKKKMLDEAYTMLVEQARPACAGA
jgi:hypothetical protein